MENELIFRNVGRPRGGRLSIEDRAIAVAQHNAHVKLWKASHPEQVKQYRRTYAQRVKSGAISRKRNIDIMKAFIDDVKNISIK